ncbi:MAG: hypothetical protein IJY50_02035 [Clostridia bacterium]|nr:hypothetical protein [Clostridia bacterium]
MLKELLYAENECGKRFDFDVLDTGKSLLLTLKKETIWNCKQLRVLPTLGAAKAGDEGYWILPRTITRVGEMQTFFTQREDVDYAYEKPMMSWYGIKKKEFCCLVRVYRNYWYQMHAVIANNEYAVFPEFDFTTHDKIYDDIRLEIVPLPETGDYNDMARAERELRLSRGEIIPLTEKCKRPAVEYARKYPLIRIRMGWKPSPSPVFHQTEATEPDMFVACDFKRVRDIADELKRQGVEGAELQLVGWNRSGHDGRFPQLFPADPRLGGDQGLKETIDYVKSLGYRISTHTNTIDCYEIADTFDWDDVVVDRDGSYNQTGHYSGGYAYHVCLEKQWKNTKRDLPALAALGENGLHFTDVISIVPPDDCHAPHHPSTTENGIFYAQKIMEYTNGLFGGFSSEGCMDFAMKHIDFGLYSTFGNGFGKKVIPVADRYLPLFEVAYHGTVLYNPTATTVNYTAQPPEERLSMILRGGRPAMYFYSKFRTGGQKNWMGENDLTCADDEALRWSVARIKEACDEQLSLADKQLIYIKGYEICDNGIEICSYEDGSRIVGNFNAHAVVYENTTIAPWSYVVL